MIDRQMKSKLGLLFTRQLHSIAMTDDLKTRNLLAFKFLESMHALGVIYLNDANQKLLEANINDVMTLIKNAENLKNK